MLAPFLAGLTLGIGLTVSALFFWVIACGTPVEPSGYVSDDDGEDFTQTETPSPITFGGSLFSTDKRLVDHSHERSARR